MNGSKNLEKKIVSNASMMLDELRKGRVYMKMRHAPSVKKT